MLGSLFNKQQHNSHSNFIKKKLQQRFFLEKFANFFKKAPFTEHLRWLLLTETLLVKCLSLISVFSSRIALFYCFRLSLFN